MDFDEQQMKLSKISCDMRNSGMETTKWLECRSYISDLQTLFSGSSNAV